MSAIEQLTYRAAQIPTQGSTGAGDLRQTWLKALEQSGLHDALQMTKRFQAGTADTSPRDTQEIESASSQGLPAERSPDPEGNSIVSIRQTVSANAVAVQPNPVVSPLQAGHRQESDFALAEPIALIKNFLGDSAAVTTKTARVTARSEGNCPPPDGQWQAQKITFLPNGTGVEAWVRDARLSPSGVMELLAGFRDSMSRIGVSLVRVSLNGKTLDLPKQEQMSNYGNKEE